MPETKGKSSRWKTIARLPQRASGWVKKPGRIKRGLLAATLAAGIGVGAGNIAHTRYTQTNRAQTAATYEGLAKLSGTVSREMVKELPWSVLQGARNEARRRGISLNNKEFDALIDEAFAQRKKRDAGDRNPNRGGFASNPTIELIDALMNLPKQEIESRLKQLYARDTPESRQLYQHNLDRALKAKPELATYFNERAERATEAARKANSANEKEKYEQIAQTARKHAIKVGTLSGGAVLLAYILLAAAMSKHRQRK